MPLQTVASAHELPSATATCWQPRLASQLSVVQALLSLQLRGVPGVQTPAWQVSLPLHTVASTHAVPLGTFGCWQPRARSQVSAVHGLASLQLDAVPGTHTLPWQASRPLQALPSEHGVPAGTTAFTQVPTLHTSVVQGFESLQSPFTVQGWQPGIGVFVQPLTGLQASTVQALLSLQLGAVPGAQTPARQVSCPLQSVASAHDVPSGASVCWQPATGSQVSTVQGLPSLQLGAVLVTQEPAWQLSVPLHTVPSLQETPFGTGLFWQAPATQMSMVQVLPSSQVVLTVHGRQPKIGVMVQVPLRSQTSWVQALLSSQPPVFSQRPAVKAPLALLVLQASVVQGSPSSQSRGTLQGWQPGIGVLVQPTTGPQVSAVHGCPSSQSIGFPAQTPFRQVSVSVHTLPSSHAPALLV